MAEIRTAIEPVLQKMSDEEVGLIRIILEYGKKAVDELGEELNDPEILKTWSDSNQEYKKFIWDELNTAIKHGAGIVDALKGRYDEYGAQLDYIVNDVLVKSLKTTKPIFEEDVSTLGGALLRERWICEKLLESMWDKMPEEAKEDIAKDIEEILKGKGIDPTEAGRVATALITGGLTAARAILGFQFHILVARLANLIVRAAIGRGLSLVTNVALQRLAGLLFGPVGWVITALLMVPTLTGLIFPRSLDKYIPVIFIIGLKRAEGEASEVNN